MVIYQQLQAIAPRIGEQENVAALRITAQMIAHQTAQTIKSLAHVRGSDGHVDPRRWPKSEHRPTPCPIPPAGAPGWPHRSPGSLRSCVRSLTLPPTRCCCSLNSRSRSLSLPPTIDGLPCFLDPGHVVFSDDDREYSARSRDCGRIHSVACRWLQTPPRSAESLPVWVVLRWLHSSDDP
jgi:hypothetical protein